jgi:hypothetical protein
MFIVSLSFVSIARTHSISVAREILDTPIDTSSPENPRGVCRKFNWSEDLIDHILDGFEKAGLEIPPDPSE